MSSASHIANPAPPISSGPQPQVGDPQIPQVDIPHMGTSQAQVAHPQDQSPPQPQGKPQGQPEGQPEGQPQASTPPPPQQPVPGHAPDHVQLPPLPDGITQEQVDAAIAHVEKTGGTEGIDHAVLTAACAQIEARAAQQGISLTNQGAQGTGQPATGQPGPSNYVEAAVMDKQSTFDNFHQQRDNLKAAVADQRDAAQKPYQDALDKAGQAPAEEGEFDPETIKVLAQAIRELDPDTIALINAMSALNSTPGVLQSIVWMEIVRGLRRLIAQETQSHINPHVDHSAA